MRMRDQLEAWVTSGGRNKGEGRTMRVYVAKSHIDYEGFQIIGVYSSQAAAMEACAGDVDQHGRQRGDRCSVREYDVLNGDAVEAESVSKEA